MGKEILILIEDGFRDEEVIYPYYRFKEAGFIVKVTGMEAGKEYKGKFGVPVKSDILVSEVNLSNTAVVIIPGGNAPVKMREIKEMVTLVKEAFYQNKIIAAICRGGLMLAEADIIKNKKVTGYMEIARDLESAGGIYLNEEAVIDGNLITSRTPEDLPAFCSSILKLLEAVV
ncbi:MAG: type 1 glutamine amidotransferase [Actinomycetota bacterium]|nr:type 1 glutamine amidotransferase [Actinomycetota bacterium]